MLSRVLRLAERRLTGRKRSRVAPNGRPRDANGQDPRPRIHFIARDRADLIRLVPVVAACREKLRPLVVSTRPRDALEVEVLRLVDDASGSMRSGDGLHSFMTGVLADRIVRLDEIPAAVVAVGKEEA